MTKPKESEIRAILDEILAEGRRIDPERAHVARFRIDVSDPCGVWELDEVGCIGRLNFARNPDSHTWVCFSDIPDEIIKRLLEDAKQRPTHEECPF